MLQQHKPAPPLEQSSHGPWASPGPWPHAWTRSSRGVAILSHRVAFASGIIDRLRSPQVHRHIPSPPVPHCDAHSLPSVSSTGPSPLLLLLLPIAFSPPQHRPWPRDPGMAHRTGMTPNRTHTTPTVSCRHQATTCRGQVGAKRKHTSKGRTSTCMSQTGTGPSARMAGNVNTTPTQRKPREATTQAQRILHADDTKDEKRTRKQASYRQGRRITPPRTRRPDRQQRSAQRSTKGSRCSGKQHTLPEQSARPSASSLSLHPRVLQGPQRLTASRHKARRRRLR